MDPPTLTGLDVQRVVVLLLIISISLLTATMNKEFLDATSRPYTAKPKKMASDNAQHTTRTMRAGGFLAVQSFSWYLRRIAG